MDSRAEKSLLYSWGTKHGQNRSHTSYALRYDRVSLSALVGQKKHPNFLLASQIVYPKLPSGMSKGGFWCGQLSFWQGFMVAT